VNEIVVADDSETILGLIVVSLKRDGFDPATAADGVGAIAQIREHRPKLLIVDAMMPNGDGYEVCRIVSEDPEIEKPYVIMLSAAAQDSDRQRAMEVGVDEYITKPFSPAAFRKRVREILRP
jgi:DNA-binding response OmpR family regulator